MIATTARMIVLALEFTLLDFGQVSWYARVIHGSPAHVDDPGELMRGIF
jgi:hypothetical protein